RDGWEARPPPPRGPPPGDPPPADGGDRAHRARSCQSRMLRSSATRTACATTQPSGLAGPPKRARAPRPVAAITTASVEVPEAATPSSTTSPAARSARPLTSVAVITALTRAAGSGSASTTTTVLIVEGVQVAIGEWPAEARLLRPTVVIASARRSSVASWAIAARSVKAPVSSPTQGAGTPARRAKAAIIPAGSAQGSCLSTCRLTTARASTKPPWCTAEDRTRSGRSLTSTTASRPASTDTPAIIEPSLERRPQPHEGVDAERGEPAHLRVALVEEVLDPGGQLELLQPPRAVEDTPGPTDVHPRVAAVEHLAEGLELLGHHVDLGEQGEARDRLPGEADVPAVPWLAREQPVGREVLGIGVRVVQRGHQVGEHVHLGGELDARAAGAPHIDRPPERRGRDRNAAGDQVRVVVLEVGQAEPDAVVPELLVDPEIVGLALLGL